ncbi:MAG: fasciclin domain-containing protein [Hyphomicrobiales bacterium]|nr:fasciclin domain-containing protein [Hyphomicrobiales bacterium]
MTFVSRISAMLLGLTIAFGSIQASAKNIVEVADSAGTFKTLIAAAKAAGFADMLSSSSPITVFAPTDAAFAKLPKGTVENLLKPENRDQLRAILAFHVIPSRVAAADVPTKLTRVQTLNTSDTLRVKRSGKSVSVENARVVKADIEADNGIIHVVNQVLLPGKSH